jgi:hypothetical protein
MPCAGLDAVYLRPRAVRSQSVYDEEYTRYTIQAQSARSLSIYTSHASRSYFVHIKLRHRNVCKLRPQSAFTKTSLAECAFEDGRDHRLLSLTSHGAGTRQTFTSKRYLSSSLLFLALCLRRLPRLPEQATERGDSSHAVSAEMTPLMILDCVQR